ncbi:PREDICTED: protein FAM186A [Chinchilla lanigera]|uniref:protein FAM186A n=1 Tax=Chinchilla lanigera TaxID=34839 RepID=UPI00038EEE92|nr:PREDICTED: protein FAM186A [Chinchilla lanigera]
MFYESRSKRKSLKMSAKKQSEIGSDSESEKEVENANIKERWSGTALDLPVVSKLEIPFSVQAVISRIEQAQLLRAREDISAQLNNILNNVHRIITRYTALDLNSSPGRRSSYTESKKTQRNLVLENMSSFAKAVDLKEKALVYILSWLEEWNAILSEITLIDMEEHHHWIAQMEMLPETLKAINKNVMLMCKICRAFLEDKKKQKKKMLSRGTLWKTWKERALKRPATAHALRPDQIISDQLATNTKVSEIQGMLQELIGTAMFNKMESNAIKYISSTIINFSKALNMLNDELKLMNFQNVTVYVDEAKEEEKDLPMKIIQDLSEQNEMLTQKLKDAEDKCEQLIRSKVVSGHRAYISSPTFPTLKVPPGLSPQSSMAMEDTMDSILTKEFENILDESQRKGAKGTGVKWDSAISYTPQVEMTPDLTDQQYILSEKKRKILSQDTSGDNISLKKDDSDQKDGTGGYSPQNKKLTKEPQPQGASESSLSTGKEEQKALVAKPGQYAEQPALEKRKKRRKSSSEAKSKSSTESKGQHISSMATKSQDQKSGKGTWEQLQKLQPEHPPKKGPTPSEAKLEPTSKSTDKDTRSELTGPFRMFKADFASEPQRVEMKGKKQQVISGTTTSKEDKTEEKEIHGLVRQVQSLQLADAQSKVTKETLASPDGKSEQNNLELFQKAIMAFLKEKIDNTGKPSDKKRALKEEESLMKAEVEKLGVIQAKMEEYFQKVAETVTKILRKYKDIKMEGQAGEKRVKQKQAVMFTPGLHVQESSESAKSEISSFLSHESTDPVITTLLQMILAEMERERDVPKVLITGKVHKGKGKGQQEKYLQEDQDQMSGVDLKPHQLEVKGLWKESLKIREPSQGKKELLQKKAKQEQREEKQGQEEDRGTEQQKQRIQEQDEQQKHWESETEKQQKLKKQQLQARKQKVKGQDAPLEENDREMIQQIQKGIWLKNLDMSRGKDEARKRLSREMEDLKRQTPNTAKYPRAKRPEELADMLTQSSVKLSPREKSTLKNKTQLYQAEKMQRNLRTLESSLDVKHPKTVSPPTPTQSFLTGTSLESERPLTKYFPLSPGQALAVGVTPIPQEVQKMELTTSPVISQTSGVTLSSERAQAPRAALTPEHTSRMQTPFITEQAQEGGTVRTQEQALASRVPLTPEQAQTLKESLISEKTQAIQISSKTKESQIFRVPIAQGKTEALRVPHTPQEGQGLLMTLTPQQAQDLGITLTPQQMQAQGVTLTPQQAQRITFTPQQVQAFGVPLTWQKLATLAPSTLRPFQESKASFSMQQSIKSRSSPRARLPLTLSAPPAEKISIPSVYSPLQKVRPLLSQTPFTPGKHSGKNIRSAPGRLLGPQILPTSQPMLVLKGQAIPTGSLPRVSPAPGRHPVSGAPLPAEQPLHPEALSSSHFFTRGGPLTPWPPLSSQASLPLRPPLVSCPSGQIPRLWTPLSPGQSLVPGVSSISREELRESAPLAFSEWPQGFRPPATPELPLQTPATFGQPLAPWTLPEPISPLWLPPTPRHPSIPWAPPTPGKPQRVSSSSVTQKRLAIVSSLKSKSVVVQARATDFRVSQAAFTTKKLQISEPPDTDEETQILQDTGVTEPLETLPLSLTSYRTPGSQAPYTDEAVLPTSTRPAISLPSLPPRLPKMPQSSPSEGLQKPRFPSTDQPWTLTSVSGTQKHKMMVPPSSPKETVEKRYFVDVEAQRKNLILLIQATKDSGLPPQQHTTARNLIIGTLHMDTIRLGYLVRKYIAYRLIQRARNNIIKRLKAIQNTGRGHETRSLYTMLSRIDAYQKRVMAVWSKKQKSLEQKRNQGLKKMVHLFSQFQKMYKLNLSQPIPLMAAKKKTPTPTTFAPQPVLELLIEEEAKTDIFNKFRQREAVREAVWNADLSTSSYPITKKTSVTSLWAQLGGYPDIPRLLQLDIQSTFRKSLASVQSQKVKD